MSAQNGGPAFPTTTREIVAHETYGSKPMDAHFYASGGMTLRDYFAGQFLTTVKIIDDAGASGEAIARNCYRMADAMLTERAKESK